MRSDGWRLIAIPLFPNPFDMDHYTFTKLSLWSLIDYHRIVFLGI
jgi:alpha-N-acetylglucosamine transferase